MIIDLEHKFCIMTPPKCGSTSFNASLARFPSITICCGPSLTWGDCNIHTHIWPDVWKLDLLPDMKFYILTRHPYLRLMSLYGATRKGKYCKDLTFHDFMKHHVISGANVFLSTPVFTWYCAWHNKYPHINIQTLHFENCVKVFKEGFGMNLAMPHMNKSHDFTPDQLYDDELLEIARLWGHFDFMYFHYDDEAWW